MYKRIIEDLKLDQIEESGQCFRFVKTDNPAYLTDARNDVYKTIYKGYYLEMTQYDKEITFSCDENEFNKVWYEYFDLETDYSAIKDSVDSNDLYLTKAVEYGDGIRILRQDLWEMIISFIISQRKSIPAIRTSIESLCTAYGDEIKLPNGSSVYAFPTPEKLSKVPFEELGKHSLGYRDKYIYSIANEVATGRFNLSELYTLSPDEALGKLLTIYGVGVKVASCVSLFGLHNIDAFPEDVWIKRIIEEEYNGVFDKGKYKGFAGVIQQYMFFYGRTVDK